MSIIHDNPPNFELILKAFPDAGKAGVIFAYGKDIYSPYGEWIPPALIAHEAVHQRRQLAINDHAGAPGSGIEVWWDKYVHDTEFRYREELAAHAEEYLAQARSVDRNQRAKLLMSTAARLIAPLYNYQPWRSLNVAMRDLRWELGL